ncbi:Mo25-like protein [Metschnikowia bicuspidata var. bicuspidata NRRL YB-4993]|uniref:Mo25-like protein n=1 Tax=Metschnikowia bicuspidata var. bicuspidata NRRL YB-4993 TaxID=869754 RepID=A0A1A0HKQ0_9ASCO|nr:Mo25-like protein [Metschnikowia bicuspidata var. bicuspidata NRRL YB-4993]OBA24383.1 Mo25-like protein [Metschnikowia bicuspidata var. bicuspidata NRRL YB-4993]
MAFLFKRNPKSPSDLVRLLNELVSKLDYLTDSRKYQDDCHRYLKQMKVVFHGDEENDPQPDQIALLAQEIYSSDCLLLLVQSLRKLDFDLRKDIVTLFLALLRRRIGNDSPTVDYLVHGRPDILVVLMRGPEASDTALVCGQILRDCVKFEQINRYLLYHPLFWKYFRYAQNQIFEVATDTFVTLNQFLTLHKKLVSEFLAKNCENFTQVINGLIKSDNYVTKRQSIRLLTELVMQKLNQQFLMYYFDDTTSLKIIMMLLSDKLKNVQLEGFHVFKFFVAKPKKSQKILDILTKNKENFIQFFSTFDVSEYGSSIVEERDYIMHEIQKLPDIERRDFSST